MLRASTKAGLKGEYYRIFNVVDQRLLLCDALYIKQRVQPVFYIGESISHGGGIVTTISLSIDKLDGRGPGAIRSDR